MKEIVVTPQESGEKLIRYLNRHLPEASTGFLYKMLRKKNITINEKKCSGNESISEGDHIQIFFSDETYAKMSGQKGEGTDLAASYAISKMVYSDIKERILFENEDYIAFNKRQGELSQKASDSDRSVNEILIGYLLKDGQLDENLLVTFKPSVINRLDRNTSGVILFGKTMKALQNGGEMMQTHDGNKTYRCISYLHSNCKFNEKETEISGFLTKDTERNIVKFSDFPMNSDSKDMLETVRVIQRKGDLALLEIRMMTGRSHQIRASLYHYGAPILMDPKYGDPQANRRYGQDLPGDVGQLLHAYSVELPRLGKVMAPMPETFTALMNDE